MDLFKQDHNAIKSDLRAAVVLYPKRLSKNGHFKPVCGAARARAGAHAVLEIPMHARRRARGARQLHETDSQILRF